MTRFTAAMYFTLATVGLFLNSQTTHGQIAPRHGSVIDHYQNLFHGGVSNAGLNMKTGINFPQNNFRSANHNHLPANNFVAHATYNQPHVMPPTPSFQPRHAATPRIDFENAFGQKTPPLSQTLQMPRVDHSRLLHLINLHRNELFRMMQTGATPSMQEMDGLWYGFDTGRLPEMLGFSQFIKDLRTNSPNPMGSHIRVHQLPPSQLNNGNGWKPKFNLATGAFERDDFFAILPPDGIGQYGHAARGNYAMGGNKASDPANRIRSRIVKLDNNILLGQSRMRVGNRFVHVGFFVLQRVPPTNWNQR